jgi:hypothetical protein
MSVIRFHTTIGPDRVIRPPEGIALEPGDVEVTIVPRDASDDESTTNDAAALEELRQITPSNDQLLKLAQNHPPPQSWFDEDEERPW